MNVVATKGKSGWEAKDVVEFDGALKLTVSTRKSSIGQGLITSASVSWHKENSTVQILGVGGGGDYSERIITDVEKRATSKAVCDQHAEAMKDIDKIIKRAKTWYAKYPRRPEE